jgi:hypothetical protein
MELENEFGAIGSSEVPTVKVVQVHLIDGTKISALAADVDRKTGDPIRVNPAHVILVEAATDQSA